MLTLLLALQVSTAQPVTLTLAAPERTLAIDFTQIRAVRELPDGRVLVTDRLDKGLGVADFIRNTFTPIGRTGSGPAEYRLPTALAAMPGDSTLMADEGNQRLAIIGPDRNRPILIYCHNNFSNNQAPVVTKLRPLALNIQTFINLVGYGYRNVRELNDVIDFNDPRVRWVRG